MARDTYLSLDLDYWNKADFDPALIDAVFASGLPRVVTLDHHDILPHVNSFGGLTRLVNIDYHSDFIGFDEPLHIGNWVNHVAWRAGAHYEWSLPRLVDYHVRLGHHHTGANPFTEPARLTSWRSADKREGFDADLLDRVAAVGVCVSPDYLDDGSAATAALTRLLDRVQDTDTPLVPSAKPANVTKFLTRLASHGLTAPRFVLP